MHSYLEHRKRVKERFVKEGLDNFEPVHALELLLFYAIPRIDTKPVARALLDRFGSFRGVLEAEVEQLQQVDGIGKNAATYLKLLCHMNRYYNTHTDKEITVFDNVDDYCQFLVGQFEGRVNETVFLMCLDAKCKLLCCKKLSEGDTVSTNMPIRRVMEIAMNTKATMVILAHNHPGGVLVPSQEDILVTEQLRMALEVIKVRLIDHVIVSGQAYTSMARTGYFRGCV